MPAIKRKDHFITIVPQLSVLRNLASGLAFKVDAKVSDQKDYNIFIQLSNDRKKIAGRPTPDLVNRNMQSQFFQKKIGVLNQLNGYSFSEPIPDLFKVWSALKNEPRVYYRAFLACVNSPSLFVMSLDEGLNFEEAIPFLPGKGYEKDNNGNKVPFSNYYARQDINTNLPALIISGNKIFEDSPRLKNAKPNQYPAPIILRGVNISGMEYRRFYELEPGAAADPLYTKFIQTYYRDPDWWDYVIDKHRNNKVTWSRTAGIIDKKIGNGRLKELASWGANIIRLTVNQDRVLNGFSDDKLQLEIKNAPAYSSITKKELKLRRLGADYLSDIDEVIRSASACGLRVIISCHTMRMVDIPSDHLKEKSEKNWPKDPVDSKVKEWLELKNLGQINGFLPDNNTLLFWAILASRYKDCSCVLYDLFNEPHTYPNPRRSTEEKFNDFYGGIVFGTSDEWSDAWNAWVASLEEIIHAIDTKAKLVVSGFGGSGGWSSSIQNMPVKKPDGSAIRNTIYSSHWYDQKKETEKDSDKDQLARIEQLKKDLLLDKKEPFGYPIIFGEWGSRTAEAMNSTVNNQFLLKWGKKFLNFIAEYTGTIEKADYKGIAGLIAWSYNDYPRMFFRDKFWGYEPGTSEKCAIIVTKEGKLLMPAPMECATDYGKQVIEVLLGFKEWEATH